MLTASEEVAVPAETAASMEDVAEASSAAPGEPADATETDTEGINLSVYAEVETIGRAQGLKKAAGHALEQTLKKCSAEEVAKCFPWLAKQSPEALEEKVAEIREGIRLRTMDEFNRIVDSRDLIRKLEELDQMVDRAIERQTEGATAQPHRIAPDSAIRASCVPLKRIEAERLRNQILEMEATNKGLINEVNEAEAFLKETQEEFELVRGQISQLVDALQSVDTGKMQNLIEELTGTTE
ncbi:hypothetical protein DFJ74DRAFT_664926 [Hyaloraphidium curvatum]|nr:hypothetical protein DFJ74DRAFT_664926 [Hyaloraphidium curvatum]